MKNLYITPTGKVLTDESGNVSTANSIHFGIDSLFSIKEDTKIIYSLGEYCGTIDAKAGDIAIVFYESHFPNRVIVVNSKEWLENLDAYGKWEQERKEQWAKNASDKSELNSLNKYEK